MTITHKSGELSSTWFTKQTSNGLTLNYHATAPVRYKKSVVRSFVNRIYNSCSTWKNFDASMEKARDILRENQYPDTFSEPIIFDTLEKIILNKQGEYKKSFNEKETGKKLFYIQYRSMESTKFIQRLLKAEVPIEHILTTKKVKTELPSLKPAVEKSFRSNIIYQIKCTACNAAYVGLTSRHLITRLKEHFSKTGLLTKHSAACGVTLDPLQCTEILDSI